jgi:predicted transcriptional regulator
MMGERALTLNVEEETLARLEALARETGRSSAQLAGEALQRYVEYESWKTSKIRDALRRADAGDFASDEEMQAVFERYRHAVDAPG